MGGAETRLKWATIMRVYWRIFADPAKSWSASLFKALVVVAAAFLALNVALPEVGVPYFSRAHVVDVMDSLADLLVWYLVLIFVRERDEARAQVKACSHVSSERG
jgi:hypothetical protein